MFVIKRDGRKEKVSFDKVLRRLEKMSDGIQVNFHEIAQKVCSRIYDGVNTDKLDELAAYICSSMIADDPEYDKLASRIVVSNHHKKTNDKFSDTIEELYLNDINQLISDEVYEVVQKYKEILDKKIQYDRDYSFDYFGFKTLEKSYLLGIKDKTIERPQDLFMRVSIGIHGNNIDKVIETYNCLSEKYFVHATPTLFNFGTKRQQGSSCFVAGTLVFTTNRGTVPIEEVCIGDSVITHTGSVKPVIQTHKNPLDNRQLYNIKIYKTPSFDVTGNHRFWSITKEQLGWKESPQWNSIENLRVGDWISIPKSNAKTVYEHIDMYQILKDVCEVAHWTYSFEFDKNKMRRNTHYASDYRPNGVTIKGEWFERYITVDENFAWFLGAWYGDGCILHGRSSPKGNRVSTYRGIAFAQNSNNTESINEIIRIGEKYLGVHASVHKAKKQNCVSISFNNSAIGNAFNILCGRYSHGKYLMKNIHSWSREMVVAMTGGFISTDGCCTLNGGITLQLTNQELIQSLFHVTRSVGLDTSMTVMNKYSNDNTQKIGRMSIPWIPEIMKWVKKHYEDSRLEKTERANTTMEIDGNIFLRINDKTKITDNLPTYVYTLGVEDDHSYSVAGVVAENCFLIHMEDDSVDGMYNTLHDCAMISKYAGGIGLHIHNVRSNGSLIRGTNGVSSGIVPMLRVFNNTARHINQAGKRNGSIAIYLEPWHGDIYSFLDMKKNHGNEEERARDLFYALWIPDLFMQRVEENGKWSLMCPDQCKGLSDVYDEEDQKNFTELYTKYESEGKYLKQVDAQDLWFKILESQIETGTPYILYKDSVNRKSNHKNLGIVKSSNLCVAPETKILTSEGYKVISELKDQEVEVFNGDEFSSVIVRQTGQNQKLLTIKTKNGKSLRCTPYHKFYVYDSNAKNREDFVVEAKNLRYGMYLIEYYLPRNEFESDEEYKYRNSDNMNDQVIEIIDNNDYDDTYCFNEPLKHRGIFNGILTGNCTEIMEYTAPDEIAVCNLASICLPSYLKTNDKNEQYIDYSLMKEKVKVVTRNLNKIIDRNFYPNEKASKSNFRHRPIGIGVQGLADLYIQLGHAFESTEAADINKKVFATIYYGALEASMELAKERMLSENISEMMNEYEKDDLTTFKGAYSTYEGSPISEGKLQYDLWNVTPEAMHDWDYLKGEIAKYGVRNSLLLAPMPTASTAQIMGFTEAFEPITANIYKRRTLAGEFIVVNKNLVKDLKAINLWDKNMKDKLIVSNGSVQSIKEIPDDIKLKYKTVWEISQKHIINQAADRGAYIDQSQSMNLFMEDATYKKLTNMHFYAWKKGLKTGMYYLRTKAKAKIQQFSIDANKTKSNFQDEKDDDGECVMCSA